MSGQNSTVKIAQSECIVIYITFVIPASIISINVWKSCCVIDRVNVFTLHAFLLHSKIQSLLLLNKETITFHPPTQDERI